MPCRLAVALLLSLSLLGCSCDDDKCGGACGEDETCCNGACVNLETDKANCGSCSNSCDLPNVTPLCQFGDCAVNCKPGFGNCDSDKRNGCEFPTASDVNNCGLCGRVCETANAVPVCTASRCAVGSCEPDYYGDCNDDALDGCETDTRTTTAHCATCGNACNLPNATPHCADSVCRVTSCHPGFGNCDLNDSNGCEIDTVTNADHCGACNFKCGPGQYCRDSECRADELIYFGGSVDLQSCDVVRELWRFDLNDRKFYELAPTCPGSGCLTQRYKQLAVYDLPRNRMLVFGGADCLETPRTVDGGAGVQVMDAWALSFASTTPAWSRVTSQGDVPSPRTITAAALDRDHWKVYAFGGEVKDDTVPTCAALPPWCKRPFNDFYVLDLATMTWTMLADDADVADDGPRPRRRFNARAAFDPVERAFVLYGGAHELGRIDLNELWLFKVDTGVWTNKSQPTGEIAHLDPPRNLSAMFNGHPVLLYSGASELTTQAGTPAARTDLWALDLSDGGAVWTQRMTPVPPEGRIGAGFAPRDGQRYVYGGLFVEGVNSHLQSDLWEYETDGGTWLRLSDGDGGVRLDGGAGTPRARFSGSLIAR